MRDPEQLNALVDELVSDPGYVTGKRKFPKPVTGDDAVAIAAGLQGEVDNGVARRNETIANQGMTLACGRGCNYCCTEPIMVFRPEAAQVARWLKEHAEVREAFLAAYPAWKQAVGATPQKLSDLSSGDQQQFLSAHVEGWRKEVMCPFNHAGDCSIYEVRPITCRNGHAIDTNARCTGASDEPATRVNFVPLDRFIQKARNLLSATHNAVGGPRGKLEALPNIVFHMLQPRR